MFHPLQWVTASSFRRFDELSKTKNIYIELVNIFEEFYTNRTYANNDLNTHTIGSPLINFSLKTTRFCGVETQKYLGINICLDYSGKILICYKNR